MQPSERDVKSGLLLIIASTIGIIVMALHPTGHALMDPVTGGRTALINAVVHSLAIASAPMLFLAMLGVARYLGHSDLTTAALVAFGFAGVAVMCAAIASGFVAPATMKQIVAAQGSTANVPQAFLAYTSIWNQAFAKVHTVASSVGIILWSAAILRSGRIPNGIAWFGVVIGVAIPVLLMSGVLVLNIHGFGAVVLSQTIWFVSVGWALMRRV